MPKPPVSSDPYETIATALPDFEDDAEATLTLLAQSMRDPPKSVDMNIAGPGEPEEMMRPGAWRLAGFKNRRTNLPANCPVVPLGKNKDVFFFLNTLGEVHTLAANAGKGHIDALFAGRGLYLCWAWPRWVAPKKDDGEWQVNNWAAEDARTDLFAACAFSGTFELEDRVRGRGAWRDDDGSLIFHAGDAVWIGGKWKPPGAHGRFIYPGRPKIGRPIERLEAAGEGSPGDLLLQALQSWNWDRGELDARLALGWLMTALVGGALEQRPSIFVTGTEGSGKSTLLTLLQWVMNGALLKTGNTTQAGIYQKIQQDSIAVIVDEMADKEDTRNADKILELARVAYSGDNMNRGGKDGVGVEFQVRSSFMFSSIGEPAMDAQDASRMAKLMMRERVTPGQARPADILDALGLRKAETAQAIGRHLLRRMFHWFKRWDELRGVMREMLLAAGHVDRSADTFGALAAGCHVALCDEMPTPGELEQWAAWLRADQLTETANKEKTWQRCFWHMLDAAPEALKHNTHHKTAATAVQAFVRQPAEAVDDLAKVLGVCGLALSFPKGADRTIEFARLFVPFKSPQLHALFEGTPWAGRLGAPGPWGGVLRQMPQDYWTVSTCDKGLNKAARGLMIDFSKVLEG